MKRFLLLAILIASICVQAQNAETTATQSVYPQKRFNVGILVSDFFSERFTLSASYRVAGPNVVTLAIGSYMGNVDMDGDFFSRMDQPANSIYIGPDYKRYFYGNTDDHFFAFAKTHFVYQNLDVSYVEKAWVPVNTGGVTYLKYRDTNQNYHVESVGIGLEGGVEVIAGPFFTEFSFGFQYKFVVSNDTAPVQFSTSNGPYFYDFDYTGFAPVLSIRIGFYLF